MSTALSDADIADLGLLLSAERLAALTTLTGSSREAIALHQETLRLGSSLMMVVAVVEIALRNAVCERLGEYFKSPGWLLRPPASFRWRTKEMDQIPKAIASARRSEYSNMSQAQKHELDARAFPRGIPPTISHMDRAKARQAKIVVSNGKVIAELTLFFWKRLFSSDYEHALWRPTLKRVFPDKRIDRAAVATHLEHIYQARNRLAHHEPVYGKRLADVQLSISFVLKSLGSGNPSSETALAKLLVDDVAKVDQQAAALEARYNSFRTSQAV